MGGKAGDIVGDMLEASIDAGKALLHKLVKRAVERLLSPAGRVLALSSLFNAEELSQLADALASTTATAEMLGRALVRDFQSRTIEKRMLQNLKESIHDPIKVPIPVKLQDTNYTCGAAALQAILDHWGIETEEGQLAKALGTDSREGTRPSEIIALANALGLGTDARAGLAITDLQHTLDQGIPVLVPVQMYGGGHYLVLTGYDSDRVYFMDPSAGQSSMPQADFLRSWHDTDTDGKPFIRYGLAIGPKHVKESITLHEELDTPQKPIQPEKAVGYFKGLVPTLGTDPKFTADKHRRQAFTMAVATDKDLLTKVQATIRNRLETGEGISKTPRVIDQILQDAGVSPKNPGYSEMVWRTNAMDAYNTGAEEERQDPDVIETFPVWRYANPHDVRSRKEHAERAGKYYPATVSFFEVRGRGINDAANCRCTSIPIDKWDWAELKGKGARIAAGYPDVPIPTKRKRREGIPSLLEPTTPEPVKQEPTQPKPAPSPITAKQKAKAEPVKATAKQPDPLEGHPLKGLSPPEQVAALGKLKAYDADKLRADWLSKLGKVKVPNEEANRAKLQQLLRDRGATLNSFTSVSVGEIGQSFPDLSAMQVQALIDGMRDRARNKGILHLTPFTQSASELPPQDLLYSFPMSHLDTATAWRVRLGEG